MNYLKRKWDDFLVYFINKTHPFHEDSLSDNHLNINTLTNGQELLSDLAMFPKVLDNLILEYCVIYRTNHMNPYTFDSVNKTLYDCEYVYFLNREMITPLLNLSIQKDLLNNTTPMIWFNNHLDVYRTDLYWSILIEHMVRKEIECKEQHIAYNIIVLCDYDIELSNIWNIHTNYRFRLDEKWLRDDRIKLDDKLFFQTTNNFTITFTSLERKPIDNSNKYYDLLITDVYEKGLSGLKCKEINELYKKSKQILCIEYFEATVVENIQRNVDADYKMKFKVIHLKTRPLPQPRELEEGLFELTKKLFTDIKENKIYTRIAIDMSQPEPWTPPDSNYAPS